MDKDQLRAPIKSDAIKRAHLIERAGVSYRLNWLNEEMMRLPMDERRKRWMEYYTRLGELTKR